MVLATLIVVLLIAVTWHYFLTSFREGAPETTTSQSMQSPRISNVEIAGYLYSDEELYMRLKISGEVDLRNRLNINGVYGWWFGRITVSLPDGSQGEIMDAENHENFFTQFTYLPGSITVDVYLPWTWYEEHSLEGFYNVTVWLQGPYEKRVVLFEKSFNLKMMLKAFVTPTTWRSWEENVSITITNTGNVPLILRGVGMEASGTGTVIGWLYAPTIEERIIVVMPGETRKWTGTPTMASNFKEELSGKTIQVDFVLDIAGASQRFAVTTSVNFP